MHYVGVLKVQSIGGSLFITCSHSIAPIGEKIFAVLGKDRIMYVGMDSEIGKEYAVRVLRKTA